MMTLPFKDADDEAECRKTHRHHLFEQSHAYWQHYNAPLIIKLEKGPHPLHAGRRIECWSSATDLFIEYVNKFDAQHYWIPVTEEEFIFAELEHS